MCFCFVVHLLLVHVHSPYHLNVSEHHSSVKLYREWDSSNYTSLQHVPIRPDNDFYPLNDIVVNGQAISGEHVNILAAVKSVSRPLNKAQYYIAITCGLPWIYFGLCPVSLHVNWATVVNISSEIPLDMT